MARIAGGWSVEHRESTGEKGLMERSRKGSDRDGQLQKDMFGQY